MLFQLAPTFLTISIHHTLQFHFSIFYWLFVTSKLMKHNNPRTKYNTVLLNESHNWIKLIYFHNYTIFYSIIKISLEIVATLHLKIIVYYNYAQTCLACIGLCWHARLARGTHIHPLIKHITHVSAFLIPFLLYHIFLECLI